MICEQGTAYRFTAPALRNAGYRVACTDLRGHGESDATFASYGDVETSSDIIAVIEELDGPAVVVGNSMGAGAAVYAAAERPDLINGLVLIGPFVRNGKISAFQRILLRTAMARPWAAMSWNSYLPKLYKGQRPVDFDEYRRTVVSSLRRPGYAKSFSLTTRTDHTAAESRLGEVATPTWPSWASKTLTFQTHVLRRSGSRTPCTQVSSWCPTPATTPVTAARDHNECPTELSGKGQPSCLGSDLNGVSEYVPGRLAPAQAYGSELLVTTTLQGAFRAT